MKNTMDTTSVTTLVNLHLKFLGDKTHLHVYFEADNLINTIQMSSNWFYYTISIKNDATSVPSKKFINFIR